MVNTFNIEDYADIKAIAIDKTRPAQERLIKYIEDVKNPYTVRVGDILVHLEFSGLRDFQDALTVALLM